MRDLMRFMKRVWTVVFAAALILTSAPTDVFAKTPEDGFEEPAVTAEEEDELLTEPSSEEEKPAGDPNDENSYASDVKVIWDLTGCSVSYSECLRKDDRDWYVYRDGPYNYPSFSFELSVEEDYMGHGTSYEVRNITVRIDNEGYQGQERTIEPENGKYTISGYTERDDDAKPRGPVYITASAVSKQHTVTVDNKTGEKAAFEPGEGMTDAGDGKYTVEQASGYSFTVKDVIDDHSPKVTIGSDVVANPKPEDGVYKYTVNAGYPCDDQTVTVEIEKNRHQIIVPDQNVNVLFSTRANPSFSDFKGLNDNNNGFYEGDYVYLIVETEDGFILDSVKAGDETLTREKNKEYYKVKFKAEDLTLNTTTSEEKAIHFDLHGVKTLKYKVGGGAEQTLSITDNNGYLPVGTSETVYITGITAATGYDVRPHVSEGTITDYDGVSVKKAGTTVVYDPKDKVWTLGRMTDVTTVTVSVGKPLINVTVNDPDKKIKSIRAHGQTLDFADGTASLSIEKGSRVLFFDAQYNDEHSLLSSYKVGKTVQKPADDNSFSVVFDADGTVELATSCIEFGQDMLTNKTGDGNDITGFEITKGTEEEGGKKYLKREGGIEFTLTPRSDMTVRSVSYVIGSDKTVYTAQKSGGNSFAIPADDIVAGILAGGITLTAETVTEKVAVTFNKDDSFDQLKYTEYVVSTGAQGEKTYKATAAGEVTLDFNGAETKAIEVENGNVIAVKLTPANGNITLSKSVELDGNIVPIVDDSYPSPLEKGTFLVAPAEPADGAQCNVVTARCYAPVGVSVIEAKGRTMPEQDLWKMTETIVNYGTVYDEDAGTQTTGNDIGFTYRIYLYPAVSDYDVTLEDPSAYYNDGYDVRLEIVKNDDGTYMIPADEVAKAVIAGKEIIIAGHAKPVEQKLVIVKGEAGSPVMEFNVSAYKDRSCPDYMKDMYVLCDTEGMYLNIRTGNYLVIHDIEGDEDFGAYLDEDTDFIRITKTMGDKTEVFYTKPTFGNSIAIGYITDNCTITVGTSKLSKDKVRIEDRFPVTSPGYTLSAAFDNDALSGNYVKTAESARVDLNVEPIESEKMKNYKISSEGICVIDKGQNDIYQNDNATIRINGRETYYDLTFEELARAAFSDDGAILYVRVEDAGFRKQKILVKEGYDKDLVVPTATVDGKTVEYSDGWMIPYGENVDITVTPRPGTKLNEVIYTPAVFIDSLPKDNEGNPEESAVKEWLNKRNNKYVERKYPNDDDVIDFNIPCVDEPIYMYIDSEGAYYYYATIDDYEMDYIKNGGTISRDVYPSKKPHIHVWAGEFTVSFDDWNIKATVPDDDPVKPPVDVTDIVCKFDPTSIGHDLEFQSSESQVQGKTVTLSISISSEEVQASFTMMLNVNKQITENDIKFSQDDFTIQLGETVAIPVEVKKDLDMNRVSFHMSGTGTEAPAEDIRFTPDLKNGAVILETKAKDWPVLLDRNVWLSIVDALDETRLISSIHLSFSSDEVTNFPKDVLDKVSATATNNTITVNLPAVPSGYKRLDGLYYLVSAKADADPTADGLKKEPDSILVPATGGRCVIDLADSSEAFSADSFKYTVTTHVVQTYFNFTIATSDAAGTKDVYTTAGGVFATKLTFAKNKDKNLAKIYSSMGEVMLGTVSFPDVAARKPVTVKKLKKVELTDGSGNVLFSSDDPVPEDPKPGEPGAIEHSAVLRIRNSDSTIFFNPHEAGFDPSVGEHGTFFDNFTGSYNLVAYAVEPKGIDVSVTYALKVEQGLTGLAVSAPGRVYKAAGKAASVKAAVDCYPVSKPLPVKKVTWSLTEDADGNKPFVKDGVAIKNGTVTIGKNVNTEDLKFYICATAADYAGHEALKATTPVTVDSQPTVPAHLYVGGREINNEAYITSDVNGRLEAYDADMNPVDATFSVSGLKVVKDANNRIECVYADKVTNKASITVISADGPVHD